MGTPHIQPSVSRLISDKLIWRTVLQPVVVIGEVSVGDSEIGAGEVEDAVAAEAVVVDVEDVARKRRTGSQSPNWDVWSRMERSRAWRRSTSTLFPSKSTRSLTASLDLLSRMRF